MNNTYYNEANEIEIALKNIEIAKERYNHQVQIASEAEYIKKLIFADYVKCCKVPKNMYDYLPDLIELAFKEQHNETKKEHFYQLENMLKKDFFDNKKIKLEKIICCGYEGYGYDCEISYSNINFRITLPILSHINTANFEYAHEGKIYCGYKENDCCIGCIILDYSIEKIAEAIKNFLENKNES